MKRALVAAAGLALFAASGLASAASWSVFVEPGVYGRVAVGGYAEPPVVYAPQPVMVVDDGYGGLVEEVIDPAYATDQPPVYLWVPEYQRQHWDRYCRDYGAVGVPVYFVDDGWYRANVMRRNWTPEQRGWTQQQWREQDRLARDRFERQRFEQQRHEQQQRWINQREWYGQPHQQARWGRGDDRGDNHGDNHGDNGRADRGDDRDRDADRGHGDDRTRWGGPSQAFAPGQANPPPHSTSGGGQWRPPANGQPAGGNSAATPSNGQWQPAGNGGRRDGGQGGWQGNAQGSTQGSPQGNAQGGWQGNGQGAGMGWSRGQQPQVPAASQPRGGRGWAGSAGPDPGDQRVDDRGAERGGRDDRRADGQRQGAFEHGRGGGRRDH